MSKFEATLSLSDDDTDLTALTPDHFLIEVLLTSIPELDISDTPINRLTRYQLLIQMRQHF